MHVLAHHRDEVAGAMQDFVERRDVGVDRLETAQPL